MLRSACTTRSKTGLCTQRTYDAHRSSKAPGPMIQTDTLHTSSEEQDAENDLRWGQTLQPVKGKWLQASY